MRKPADLPHAPDQAWREAWSTWLMVLVAVAVLVQVGLTLPGIGHVGSALIAVCFLYVPMYMANRRGLDLIDFGFHTAPVARGALYAIGTAAVLFPLFVLVYLGFYETICDHKALAELAPKQLCTRYRGFGHMRPWQWDLSAAEFFAVQLVVVALPEELFFRGYLLGLLEKRFVPKHRVWGGGVGLALILSSLAFAIIHLPKDGDPRALATFFPGLMFGWMRSATGSIMASTVVHAGSNFLVRMLERSLF